MACTRSVWPRARVPGTARSAAGPARAAPRSMANGFPTLWQHAETEPADRVGRVVDGAADAESDPSGGQFVGDRPGVWEGAGEAVEFGHDQGVAVPAGGQRFAEVGRSRLQPVSPV